MGTTYVWVGGHTGYTGTNSGYSATGGGPTGANPRWTNVITGQTSDSGDFYFGPYFWSNTKNWLRAVQATGSGGAYNYSSTTVLPKGGDSVIFTGSLTGVGSITGGSGNTLKTYSVSCLYGGMSGDGFTASSATGWAGGWTAGSGAHGTINFVVQQSFNPYLSGFDLAEMLNKWGTTLRVGEIGVGATGNLDNYSPLRIRATSFNFTDGSQVDGYGAMVAVNNIHNTGTPWFTMGGGSNPNSYRYGKSIISGKWTVVQQSSGTLLANNITNTDDNGYYSVSGYPVQFGTSSTVSFRDFNINVKALRDGGYIYGNSGSQAKVVISGYSNTNTAPITLGAFNDGSTPTFESLSLFAGGSSDTAITYPTVKLASCQIDNLTMNGGKILVSENSTQFDYCIIRDGYAKGTSVIDMSHPQIETWQNFILSYSPGDEGLRLDDSTVSVKPYRGASFKTGTAESPTGAFGY